MTAIENVMFLTFCILVAIGGFGTCAFEEMNRHARDMACIEKTGQACTIRSPD